MTEEQKKRRNELCKKAGWNNGPGHCEGVAFHDGYDAGYADAKEEGDELYRHMEKICNSRGDEITELTRKLEVAKKALKTANTGYNEFTIAAVEAALKELE